MLGALEGEPAPLEGGITNRNYRRASAAARCVIRLPGKDTEPAGIDREAEREANEARRPRPASRRRCAAMLEDPPCLVTALRRGRGDERRPSCASRRRWPRSRRRCAALHGCGERLAGTFSAFRMVETYAERARGRGAEVPGRLRARPTRRRRGSRRRWRGAERAQPVLCHNDLLAANFLAFAGRASGSSTGSTRAWATAGSTSATSPSTTSSDAERGGGASSPPTWASRPAPGELAALRLMRFMSDFREAMWGVLQGTLSDLDFDFAAYAAKHFERLRAPPKPTRASRPCSRTPVPRG